MNAYQVTYRNTEGRLIFGVYIIAPSIERAIQLSPGPVEGINLSGPCIAVDSERDVSLSKWWQGRNARAISAEA